MTSPTTPTLHQRLERQLNALLSISKRWRLYDAEPVKAFKAITEAGCSALAVDRTSVWLLTDDRDAIVCQDLYEFPKHRHSRGFKLSRMDHPEYFAALESEDIVAATDAVKDPRTRSFAKGYLDVHGIGSMLDTPIRVGGNLVGVVCHEHVGEPRLFMADEQTTARLLSNHASLACESRARAESQRKEQESLALFTAAVESAGLAVYASDLEGNLTYFNAAAQTLYGFPDALLNGKGTRAARLEFAMAKMKHPDKVGTVLKGLLADPASTIDDFPIELKDGRTLKVGLRPNIVGGKIVGRVWTARG